MRTLNFRAMRTNVKDKYIYTAPPIHDISLGFDWRKYEYKCRIDEIALTGTNKINTLVNYQHQEKD